MKVQFFLHKNYPEKANPVTFPSFSLDMDEGWNDYGTRCLFRLRYHPERDVTRPIGKIKILEDQQKNTSLPEQFYELDSSFISLGQSISFYENLRDECGQKLASVVLTALRDISWTPDISRSFEPTSNFRNALLRSNGANKARRFGSYIISGRTIDETFAFKYRMEISNYIEPFDVEINLDENDEIPGRIVGIIGRNAVGKTQFLAALASDLVQLEKSSQEKIEKRERKFYGQRPIFTVSDASRTPSA